VFVNSVSTTLLERHVNCALQDSMEMPFRERIASHVTVMPVGLLAVTHLQESVSVNQMWSESTVTNARRITMGLEPVMDVSHVPVEMPL